MAVDERVFARAQRFDPTALEALLASIYPAVHRMAGALAGRADVARDVERWVMKQALSQLLLWRDAEAAQRWCYHHALLMSRRASKFVPQVNEDLLAVLAAETDAAYLAFLKALRKLPVQQREAFILHHGEKFNARYLGVAMDCSTTAAEQHLMAARETLKQLAGDSMEGMVQKMSEAYAKLTPAASYVGPSVRGFIRRTIWPRRIQRLIKSILVLLIVGTGAYYGWNYYDRIPWERIRFEWPATQPSTRPATTPTTREG